MGSHRGAGDDRQIACGGIVIVVVHAGRIGEMRIRRAAEHLRRLVHQVGKALDASGQVFRDGVGGFIARTDEHDGNQVQHGHLLPGGQGNGLIRRRNEIDGVLRNGDNIVVEVSHLQGDVAGENLGRRSGIHNLVRVFFKKHLAGIRFDEDCAVRVKHILIEYLRMVFIPCNRIRRKRRGNKTLCFRILRQSGQTA